MTPLTISPTAMVRVAVASNIFPAPGPSPPPRSQPGTADQPTPGGWSDRTCRPRPQHWPRGMVQRLEGARLARDGR